MQRRRRVTSGSSEDGAAYRNLFSGDVMCPNGHALVEAKNDQPWACDMSAFVKGSKELKGYRSVPKEMYGIFSTADWNCLSGELVLTLSGLLVAVLSYFLQVLRLSIIKARTTVTSVILTFVRLATNERYT